MRDREEIEEESRYWQNELDAKKYLIQVHDEKFKLMMGEDFKLAKLTEQQKEFIMDILGISNLALELVPYPDTAIDIQHMDMLYPKAIAILNFNQQENMIIDRTTGWQQQEKENYEKEENKWIDKLKARIKGTNEKD